MSNHPYNLGIYFHMVDLVIGAWVGFLGVKPKTCVCVCGDHYQGPCEIIDPTRLNDSLMRKEK